MRPIAVRRYGHDLGMGGTTLGTGRIGPTGPAPQGADGHQDGEEGSADTRAPGFWEGPWLGPQAALVAP